MFNLGKCFRIVCLNVDRRWERKGNQALGKEVIGIVNPAGREQGETNEALPGRKVTKLSLSVPRSLGCGS